MTKTKTALTACAILLGGSLMLPAAGNALTDQELQALYCKPVAVVKTDDGEKRYYKANVAFGASVYRMVEVRGNQMTDMGLALQPSDKNSAGSLADSAKLEKRS